MKKLNKNCFISREQLIKDSAERLFEISNKNFWFYTSNDRNFLSMCNKLGILEDAINYSGIKNF